jgi:hypothetical protein
MLFSPVLNPGKDSYGSSMIWELKELCAKVPIHIPEIVPRNVTGRTRFERSIGATKIIVDQCAVPHDAIPE